MSSFSRTVLAERLLNNWLIKNPLDSYNTGRFDIDESLTELSWLHNLTTTVSTSSGSQKSPVSTDNCSNILVHPIVLNSSSYTEYRVHKNNGTIRPPHSYATLISMAINDTQEKKMNISSIYKWITLNFPFYKMADTHWKNSIRHNLSLNKRFEKVPRRNNESGKGGYWRIKPEFNDVSRQHGDIKKRISSEESNLNPSCKRIKLQEESLTVINHNSDEEYDNVSDDDIMTYPMSSSESNCDVNSDDLKCFDDLLVFNFTDESKNQQLNDICSDLTADAICDDDWWNKALGFIGEPNELSDDKNNKLDTSDLFSSLNNDDREVHIPSLDNADDDIDICNLFHVDHIF
ncbi:hypothetical protein SNE40_014507 [Patella caerulea]|uniref:Fork-head domain-containing protein n=1 Tax=Patella caerulea TaxID=87958 RepID=A0AAN8JEU4_PATCE